MGNTSLKSKVLALGLAGAIAIVPVFEGLRLKKYQDVVKVWTDCYGHTGKDVRAVNTPAQCNDKLYSDLLSANAVVDSCVTVPLNSNQRSAFVSFAFNVGPGKAGVKDGFCVLKSGKQPTFLHKLNAGDYTGACTGILPWDKAGGKPQRGLTVRRRNEADLCLSE